MSQVHEFLNKAGVFYLATVDGDRPRLRPLGLQMEVDGKLLFGVGSFKAVYRQLLANPHAEIVACAENEWLRYSGKAVFETDPKYEAMALEGMTALKAVYNETTGNHLMMFHFEDATALLCDLMGNGKQID
ncbi:MAG: pyridoxamine 5'-phosphate oxidase family protein [Clostridia bacterium]|nr:pyridoxamine 5'-phosphate oxidase family protein [Clostridia bacterium]